MIIKRNFHFSGLTALRNLAKILPMSSQMSCHEIRAEGGLTPANLTLFMSLVEIIDTVFSSYRTRIKLLPALIRSTLTMWPSENSTSYLRGLGVKSVCASAVLHRMLFGTPFTWRSVTALKSEIIPLQFPIHIFSDLLDIISNANLAWAADAELSPESRTENMIKNHARPPRPEWP